MLVFIYEGDDANSLSQREAICSIELNLEFSQTHSNSSQLFFSAVVTDFVKLST